MRAQRLLKALGVVSIFCFAGCVETLETIVEVVHEQINGPEPTPPSVPSPSPPPALPPEPPKPVASVSPTPPSPTPASASPEKSASALQERFLVYAPCVAQISPGIHQTYYRYLQWVSPAKGPTGRERHIYGLYDVQDPAECVTAIRDISPKQDLSGIDALATRYADTVEAVVPVVQDAYKYYEHEDYKDDKFARGKTLHPQIMEKFAAFRAVDDELTTALSRHEDEARAQRIAELKQDEPSFELAREQAIDVAKKIMTLGNVHFTKMRTLDTAKLDALIAEYQIHIDALESFAKSPSLKISAAPSSIESLWQKHNAFLIAAKAFARKCKSKSPWSRGDRLFLGDYFAEWMVDGSPAKLRRHYGELLSAH